MFFIGIFGIDRKQKPLGTCNNAICPACSALTRFDIFKEYSYFHIFFIPTFRWNVKYFVKPACCGSIYELDPVVGRQYEKDGSVEIENENMRPISYHLPFKTCAACKAKFDSSYSYCPYCGNKL